MLHRSECGVDTNTLRFPLPGRHPGRFKRTQNAEERGGEEDRDHVVLYAKNIPTRIGVQHPVTLIIQHFEYQHHVKICNNRVISPNLRVYQSHIDDCNVFVSESLTCISSSAHSRPRRVSQKILTIHIISISIHAFTKILSNTSHSLFWKILGCVICPLDKLQ